MDIKDRYEKALGLKPKFIKNVVTKPENKSVELQTIDYAKNDIITIILSHTNTEEKKQMLFECLGSIKTEKLVSCNFPVDEKIQSQSNWVIYNSSNDLLLESEYDEYGVTFYHWRRNDDGDIITKNQPYEHGYAVYNLVRNALLFCKSIGKKIIHIVNYDYLISETVIENNTKELKLNDLVVYSMDEEPFWFCTGFFSGKIDSLLSFFNNFKTKKEYYSYYLPGSTDALCLEGKFYLYVNGQNIKLSIKNISDLSLNCSVNRIAVHHNPFEDGLI